MAARGLRVGAEAEEESASSKSDEEIPRPKAAAAGLAAEAARAAIFSAFWRALASCNKWLKVPPEVQINFCNIWARWMVCSVCSLTGSSFMRS